MTTWVRRLSARHGNPECSGPALRVIVFIGMPTATWRIEQNSVPLTPGPCHARHVSEAVSWSKELPWSHTFEGGVNQVVRSPHCGAFQARVPENGHTEGQGGVEWAPVTGPKPMR